MIEIPKTQDGKKDMRYAISRATTNRGDIKAGGGVAIPNEIPTQLDAHARIGKYNEQIQRVDKKTEKEIALARTFGYNIGEMNELQQQCLDELQNESRNKMSLIAWVRYIRKATENIETRENSLGSNVIDGIKKYAEQQGYDNINVKILPTFFYHGQHFPRDIDIAIDIDFMPGLEYEESIFRSLKIVPDDSAEDLCITHQDRIEAGVDHTLRVVPTGDERYLEMIKSVSREVFEGAKGLYDKMQGGNKNNTQTQGSGLRVVSFKDVDRKRDGWYAAGK